jgi:hypothetical protein
MSGDTFGRQMTTVGDRIRERRLALGLSQRELPCEGVTYAYISRLEANTRQPSVKRCGSSHRSSVFQRTGSKRAKRILPRNSRASSWRIGDGLCRVRRSSWHAPCSATHAEPHSRRATRTTVESPAEAAEAEHRMEFNRVRRHPRLAVIEIEEGDPGHACARARRTRAGAALIC